MIPNPDALAKAAESWEGTPFVPNSKVKGAGVSCHHLMGEIYRESGWIPDLPALPNGDPAHARAGNTSPMLDWLRGPGARWFHAVPPPRLLDQGDLLVVRYGHVPHHLALMLPRGRVIHVSVRHGAQILPVLPKRFIGRIDHVFRPHV